MSESSVLTDLLRTEHQAIWAYGVIGAHLDDARRDLAQAAYDAHRQLRAGLTARMERRGLPVPGPETAYQLEVTTAGTAIAEAVRVEEALAVRWRDLVASTDDRDLRGLAVRALADAAVRATRWRVAGHITPATVAFPGRA